MATTHEDRLRELAYHGLLADPHGHAPAPHAWPDCPDCGAEVLAWSDTVDGSSGAHCTGCGREFFAPLAAPAPAVGEAAPRPESGPMRFGNDWTGVFIRGDRAGAAAMQLRLVLRGAPVEHIGLEGIARLLESCDERTSTQEPQEAMLVAATPPTVEAERLLLERGVEKWMLTEVPDER